MIAATNSKILLGKKKQQLDIKGRFYCTICGKKLKLAKRISQNPLSCWQHMILNADS
jgi:hypothetical protein